MPIGVVLLHSCCNLGCSQSSILAAEGGSDAVAVAVAVEVVDVAGGHSGAGEDESQEEGNIVAAAVRYCSYMGRREAADTAASCD